MIEGLSLMILGLIIVNALYDCLRYYKKNGDQFFKD